MHKPAITQVPIAELIANRWSFAGANNCALRGGALGTIQL
jgi:hypothetical protein